MARRRTDILEDIVAANRRLVAYLAENDPERLALAGNQGIKTLLEELSEAARTGDPMPDHDGDTYEEPFDKSRLNGQMLAVYEAMVEWRPNEWFTLSELTQAVRNLTGGGDTEAAVSARIRDLRKNKFGSFSVESERIEGGLWRYRVKKAV